MSEFWVSGITAWESRGFSSGQQALWEAFLRTEPFPRPPPANSDIEVTDIPHRFHYPRLRRTPNQGLKTPAMASALTGPSSLFLTRCHLSLPATQEPRYISFLSVCTLQCFIFLAPGFSLTAGCCPLSLSRSPVRVLFSLCLVSMPTGGQRSCQYSPCEQSQHVISTSLTPLLPWSMPTH